MSQRPKIEQKAEVVTGNQQNKRIMDMSVDELLKARHSHSRLLEQFQLQAQQLRERVNQISAEYNAIGAEIDRKMAAEARKPV